MLSPRLTQKGIGVLGPVDGKPLLTLSKESHLSFSRTALPIEERGAIFGSVSNLLVEETGCFMHPLKSQEVNLT